MAPGESAMRGLHAFAAPYANPTVPLFLAPTGLADGLALKESRYAGGK
jgi:hypothetical protein